jgi:hypothetical protein
MPVLRLEGGQAYSFGNREDARIIEITTADALTLLSKYSIKYPLLRENLVGLWSFLNIGRNLKARYMSMKTPRFSLSKRKSGCQWNPKGKVTTELDEFTTGAVVYQGEQCPDAFYEECLERIFGAGNDITDMLATPEGQAIFEELLMKIYTGLSNDIYNLITWANHPLITQSDTNGWYTSKTPTDDWAAFKDQQLHAEIGGHMTVLDSLATETGLDNLNVPLQASWVSGKKFTGDVEALFQSLVDAAPYDFEAMIDSAGEGMQPIMPVTKGIFDAYESLLTTTYNAIPEGYRLRVTGVDGINENQPINNVLKWKGIWIYKATAWGAFDHITGVTQHRAVLTAPGNFGVAYRTEALIGGQGSGVAMQIEQSQRLKDQGKVYMSTNFRLGSSIMDSDFVTMASLTLTP